MSRLRCLVRLRAMLMRPRISCARALPDPARGVLSPLLIEMSARLRCTIRLFSFAHAPGAVGAYCGWHAVSAHAGNQPACRPVHTPARRAACKACSCARPPWSCMPRTPTPSPLALWLQRQRLLEGQDGLGPVGGGGRGRGGQSDGGLRAARGREGCVEPQHDGVHLRGKACACTSCSMYTVCVRTRRCQCCACEGEGYLSRGQLRLGRLGWGA